MNRVWNRENVNHNRTRSVKQTNHRQRVGMAGETLASEILKKEGYRIVKRNYSCRWGGT